MKGQKLLQTRVSARVGRWAEREARLLGVSVAAWLRMKVLEMHRAAKEGAK